MKPEQAQTHLRDFQSVFAAAQKAQLHTLLVGGHAANFWAGLLLSEEPELQNLMPFTSKDLDLLGSKDDLLRLAQLLQAEVKEMRRGAPTPVLGVIQFTTPAGFATQVEVLFSLHGLSPKELTDGAGHVFSPELGLTVYVPSPLSCLKSKTSNVVRLPQDTRQDVKHVRMLKLCNRGILRRALIALAAGSISDRAAVNALEAVCKFTQSRLAGQAEEKFRFNWLRCFPVNELVATTNDRVRSFVEHRLRRVFSQQLNDMASGEQNRPPTV